MSVKFQMNMIDVNNNFLKKISATDAQLYELATKFCNLTSNSFVNVDKIVTTSLEGGE